MIPTWGSSSGLNAIFNLPLSDSGAGAVNTTPSSAGGSATPTFTRATTAWTKLSTGLWASVASGTARYSYLGLGDSAVGAAGGYLAEGARTNLLLYSNDFTQADWAKVTMTTAMTSTGPDGVANSATRLTAAGALSTILQLYVAAASTRTWSVWMRRVTGTGTIKLFQGATKTADLASSLNASTYVRIEQAVSVDVTLLGVGIEIGTDTDAVDVWCGQFEAGIMASSPIPTTTVAVTRNGDVLSYVEAGNISGTVGSAYMEFTSAWPNTGGVNPVIAGDAASDFPYLNASRITGYDGTDRIFNTVTLPATSIQKTALSWGGTVFLGALNGTLGTQRVFDGDLNLSSPMIFGGLAGADSNALNGTIRNFRIYGSALTAAQLTALTA